MDQTPAINNLVKLCYRRLQTSSGNQSGIPMERQLICTSKRKPESQGYACQGKSPLVR